MAEAVNTGGDCGSVPPDVTDSFPSDEYECKICYNYFDLDLHTPKLLSCSHTFCQECLDTLHSREGRGWRIGCPVCRHRTPVPEYRVHNLPDNTALTEALPLKTDEPADSSNTDVQTGPAVSSVTSPESNDSCQTCKQVAFATGCVCAILSFLSMVVLLFLGLIFVHNFNNSTSPVGPVCLFVASVLALLSLILTWLMCMLKYRPETEATGRKDLRYLAFTPLVKQPVTEGAAQCCQSVPHGVGPVLPQG
ncbi:RING finger protein 228-like [Enoplosus armatus]|uniref:RING finger protein 228-like n=1 Tax=Enoplosus armatus TaxID=215367 RepID=UPI00399443A0